MDHRFLELFDRFTHGAMKRREFLEKLVQLAGLTAALAVLENNYARAAMVDEDDPLLRSGSEESGTNLRAIFPFPWKAAAFRAYW